MLLSDVSDCELIRNKIRIDIWLTKSITMSLSLFRFAFKPIKKHVAEFNFACAFSYQTNKKS